MNTSKHSLTWLPISLSLLGMALPTHAEVLSTRLKDVIKANGVGNINLFTPSSPSRVINGATLEAFRQDNNGVLAFAVDVNEAANGQEKASSQGVALETVSLVVVIEGVTHTFTTFSTQTTSLLAKGSQTTRQAYYTLIGDTGSARITNSSTSDISNSDFDATLRVPVDIDLSNASSARLDVTFLTTNQSLGDPESFYDFSNGYEDIAIVSEEDALYLDSLHAGQAEAPLVLPDSLQSDTAGNRIFYPSIQGLYLAAYEDRFPNRGDYDFNDLVVAYKVTLNLNSAGDVETIQASGYLIARGGEYTHDWSLHIPLANNIAGDYSVTVESAQGQQPAVSETRTGSFYGSPVVPVYQDTKDLWQISGTPFVNTLENQSPIKGPRFNVTVTPVEPIPLSEIGTAPFDPILYVHNSGYEIHLPGKSPVLDNSNNEADGQITFTDSANYPFAMIFMEEWQSPVELTDLGDAYPFFLNNLQSNNSSHPNWYKQPASGKTKPLATDYWW